MSVVEDIARLGLGAWATRLRRASWRGVPFYVEEHTGESGRRVAAHEYPGRDLPYAEDLGRKQRRWSFTAYLIGDAFLLQRAALIDACERAGAGTLLLPTAGAVQAVCESVAWSERRDVGRYCQLTLSFLEAGHAAEPASRIDGIGSLVARARDLIDAATSAFAPVFDTLGVAFLAASTVADIVALADTLSRLVVGGTGISAAPFRTARDALIGRASTLVDAPADLAAAIDGMLAGFAEAMTPDAALPQLLAVATDFVSGASGTDVVNATSTIRQQQGANGVAVEDLVRRLALAESGYVLPGVAIDAEDVATTLRAALAPAFDAAELRASDDVFAAVVDLRADAESLLALRADAAPAMTRYATPVPTNALTMAWRLYQDADRDIGLARQVGAINPAFLPLAGRVVER